MCDNNLYNYTRLWEDKIRATDFRLVQVVYAYDLYFSSKINDRFP